MGTGQITWQNANLTGRWTSIPPRKGNKVIVMLSCMHKSKLSRGQDELPSLNPLYFNGLFGTS